MILAQTVKVGVRSLLANKLRSILAMLGIIIGSGAVIAMLALGAGAQQQVLSRFSALGTNIMIVTPGSRNQRGVMSGLQQNLTLEDADEIAQTVPGVLMVAPAVRGGVQAKYFGKNSSTSIFGTSPTYFEIRDIALEDGRTFTDREAERYMRLAVIGAQIKKDLFGQGDPVGEVIKLNGLSFTIIGVAKEKGEGWGSPDNQIFIPYSTAMKQVLGTDKLREINIKTESEEALVSAQEKIGELLRRRHKTMPGDDDDFTITNMAEIRKSALEVTGVFRWLLGGIAAISLVVGGIGIMNVMIVTVTERTKEIGIRKAVGARERHILMQFLAESVIVSGLGGLLGLMLGVGIAIVLPKFSPFTPVLEWQSAMLSITVACGVGIFFGLYPAYKASKLDPIEALRHE